MDAQARPLYKALDAIITASLRPHQSLPELIRKFFRRRLSNYERVAVLVTMVEKLFPGVSRRIMKSLFDPFKLPFPVQQVRLLGFGSGSTGFLLDIFGETMVLKVYRRSIGKSGRSLNEIAGYFKSKYDTIASWYDGPHNLVPKSSFLILHGPLLGQPAVAVYQAFIAGEIKDFFQDFSDQELMALLEGREFREQFLFFAERTLDIYRQQRQCYDFLGRENLMVVQDGQGVRLAIIDYGIYDLDIVQNRPRLYRRIEERICWIEDLYRRVSEAEFIRAPAG